MTNHIIESIGSWGVHTTPVAHRIDKVRPGDAVAIKHLKKYPFRGREWATVAQVDLKRGTVSLCVGVCSTFLNEDGTVSISGGPFCQASLDELVPQHTLRDQRLWNWGDNWAGASQGVEYVIPRPVFTLNRLETDDET